MTTDERKKIENFKTSVKITDYSNYKQETCRNGGDYSFTIEYVPDGMGMYDEVHSTSSEFRYCRNCGTFDNDPEHEDDCPPRSISANEVIAEIENVERLNKQKNNDFEIELHLYKCC